MAETDIDMINKYKEAIKQNDRVSDKIYEDRLRICKECDKLISGTCMSCGCYVELRAMSISGRCPSKKWI